MARMYFVIPRHTSEKLSPCSHEEADTRMMVHVADAVDKGHNSIMIRTVDTDVVVLAVAGVHTLGIKELWVSFGTGKNHKILPTHRYASALGPVRSRSLPIFHALTGSDTTSFLPGMERKQRGTRGKLTLKLLGRLSSLRVVPLTALTRLWPPSSDSLC